MKEDGWEGRLDARGNVIGILPNSSIKYFNGKELYDNSGYKFIIIAKSDECTINRKTGKKSYRHYYVQYEDGTVLPFTVGHIYKGEVRNDNYLFTYGVGCLGYGEHEAFKNGKETWEYTTWHNMMKRCYCEKFIEVNPAYKGCTVIERWRRFQNFCDDIPHLEGQKTLAKGIDVEIDKDILVEGNRVYSKETCSWVTRFENSNHNSIKGKYYRAMSPEGTVYYFRSQVNFSRSHNLSAKTISKCLSDKYPHKTYKKWRFNKCTMEEYKED